MVWRRFAVTASMDATVRVWDLAARSQGTVHTHTGKVSSISVSPDGATAASVGDDGQALLWDTVGGMLRGTLQASALEPYNLNARVP